MVFLLSVASSFVSSGQSLHAFPKRQASIVGFVTNTDKHMSADVGIFLETVMLTSFEQDVVSRSFRVRHFCFNQ